MLKARLIAWAAGSVLLAGSAQAADTLQLPAGPNRDLVYGQCRTCHDLQYLKESAGIPRSAWNDLLDSMKQYGLRLSPDQRAKILEYLATYLGPNPPPKTAAAAPAAPAKVDGAMVFKDQCAACHQANAQGVAGQFPPLAGNGDLFLSRDYPVRVVLFGLSGKITVNGKNIDSAMPAFGEVLSDAQIAAVVNYVRGHFGNAALGKKVPAVDVALVKKLRAEKARPQDVHAYRQKLKSAAK
jgi:mono/diheme cytochrome c family protein